MAKKTSKQPSINPIDEHHVRCKVDELLKLVDRYGMKTLPGDIKARLERLLFG